MTATREERLPARRARRWPYILVIVLAVLLGLLVVGDRGAKAYAESTMADEIQKEGFPAKPEVQIKGFPFLTQALSRHFGDVRLKAKDIKTGPLSITSLDVRARDVRVNSDFASGTLGSVDGTAFVSFGALAGASDTPGLQLTADGPTKVRAKMNLGITDATAVASVTKEGNNIHVKAESVEDLPLEELGEPLDFTVPVSGLPLGMQFQSLNVTSKGVTLRITGSKVAFSDQ
ncbi:LmeA family phospholipid-binding protein [Actinomadura parmotrematis]|uniref:DUF2993 domain-containing protein n=1 Tax=Actinomadura parmotrematis TaxID=2864039 RepID=A0ABS7G253_9ACTN|nr:DUF2993 domain-containing protein [Actinomadura parmotrematis]MBW8486616.1 DUF2993 domain-containing protein [Actinomadura parmotrematis]